MMNLEQYFIFSSYAMFMTGYVMLASTRQLDVFSLGLFAVVLGAGWLIDSGRLSWSLGLRSANWLMAGGLVFLVAEWYALRVSPITVILHFVFFAAALRLLRRKSSRDWIWLYVVTFCQVLMTAGMMVSTTFLLLVIVYLFAATSAFIAYEMRRSASAFAANNPSRHVTVEYRKESDRRPVEEPRLRSLPVFSACALTAILLLAAPIFLAMPRVSRGFSRNGMLRGEVALRLLGKRQIGRGRPGQAQPAGGHARSRQVPPRGGAEYAAVARRDARQLRRPDVELHGPETDPR